MAYLSSVFFFGLVWSIFRGFKKRSQQSKSWVNQSHSFMRIDIQTKRFKLERKKITESIHKQCQNMFINEKGREWNTKSTAKKKIKNKSHNLDKYLSFSQLVNFVFCFYCVFSMLLVKIISYDIYLIWTAFFIETEIQTCEGEFQRIHKIKQKNG